MKNEIKLDGMQMVQDKFRERIALSSEEKAKMDRYNKGLKREHAKEVRGNNTRLTGNKVQRKQAQNKGIGKTAKTLIIAAILGATLRAGIIGMQHYTVNQNKEAILQQMDTRNLDKSGLSRQTIMALLNEHTEMKTIENMSKEQLIENVQDITGLSQQVIKEKLAKTNNVNLNSIDLEVKELYNKEDGPSTNVFASSHNENLKLNKEEKAIILQGYKLKQNTQNKEAEEKDLRKDSIELFNSTMEYTGIEKGQER